MSDWVNELAGLDGEALLKVLDRIADAAERIAENTEGAEADAPRRPVNYVHLTQTAAYPQDPPRRSMLANFSDAQLGALRRFVRETARPELQYDNNDDLLRNFFRLIDNAEYPPIPDAAFQPTPTAVWQAQQLHDQNMWRIPATPRPGPTMQETQEMLRAVNAPAPAPNAVGNDALVPGQPPAIGEVGTADREP